MGKKGLILYEILAEWFQLLKAKWPSLLTCLDASVLHAFCVNTTLCTFTASSRVLVKDTGLLR